MTWQQSVLVVSKPDSARASKEEEDTEAAEVPIRAEDAPINAAVDDKSAMDLLFTRVLEKSASPALHLLRGKQHTAPRHEQQRTAQSSSSRRRALKLGAQPQRSTLAQRLKDQVALSSGVNPAELEAYDAQNNATGSVDGSPSAPSGPHSSLRPLQPAIKTDFSSSIRDRVREAHARRQAMHRRIHEQEQAQAVRDGERKARRVVRRALKQATRAARHSSGRADIAPTVPETGRLIPGPPPRILAPGALSAAVSASPPVSSPGSMFGEGETPAGRAFIPFQGYAEPASSTARSSEDDGFSTTESDSSGSDPDTHLSYPTESGTGGISPLVGRTRKWSIARSIQGASPRSVFSHSISERIAMRQQDPGAAGRATLQPRHGGVGGGAGEEEVHVGRARADSVFSIARGRYGAGSPKRGKATQEDRRDSMGSLLSDTQQSTLAGGGRSRRHHRPTHGMESPLAPMWREKRSKEAQWAAKYGAETATKREELEASRRESGLQGGFAPTAGDDLPPELMDPNAPGGGRSAAGMRGRKKRGGPGLSKELARRQKADKPLITALSRATRQAAVAPYSQSVIMGRYYDSMANAASSMVGADGEENSDGDGRSVSRGRQGHMVGGRGSPFSRFGGGSSPVARGLLDDDGGRHTLGMGAGRAEESRIQRAVDAGTAEAVLYVLGSLARQPSEGRAKQFIEAVRSLCRNLSSSTAASQTGGSSGKGGGSEPDPLAVLSPSQSESVTTATALLLGLPPATSSSEAGHSSSSNSSPPFPHSGRVSLPSGRRSDGAETSGPPPIFDKVRYESLLQLAGQLAIPVPASIGQESAARRAMRTDPRGFESSIRRVCVQAAYALVASVLAQLVSAIVPARNEQEAVIRSTLHANALRQINAAKDEAALAEVPKDVGEGNVHIEAGGRAVATAGMRDLGRGREMDGIFRPKYLAGADALAATAPQASRAESPSGSTTSGGQSINQAVGLASKASGSVDHLLQDGASAASVVSEQRSGVRAPATVARPGSSMHGGSFQSTLKVSGNDLLQPRRKGEDRIVQSPFVSPQAKEQLEAGAIRVAKRVKAKGNWRRVATQFRERPQSALELVAEQQEGFGPGDVKVPAKDVPLNAAGTGGDADSGANDFETDTEAPSKQEQQLHGYVRKGGMPKGEGDQQWDPDLSSGHPYLVNQAYVLFRLRKDPQTFDQDWAAEAYQRQGGTADAITGYRGLLPGKATAIPKDVAERLGKKYAGAVQAHRSDVISAADSKGSGSAAPGLVPLGAHDDFHPATTPDSRNNVTPSAQMPPLSPMQAPARRHPAEPSDHATGSGVAVAPVTDKEVHLKREHRPLLPADKRPAPGKDPLGAIVGHRGREKVAMPRFGWRFGRTSKIRGPAMGGLRWYDVRELLKARATVRSLTPLLEMYEKGLKPIEDTGLPAAPQVSQTSGDASSDPTNSQQSDRSARVQSLSLGEQTVLVRQTRAQLSAAQEKVQDLERRVAGLPPPASPDVDAEDGDEGEEETKGDRFMTATVLALANAKSGDAPKSKGFAALLRDALESQRGVAAKEGNEPSKEDVDTAVGAIIAELGADESDALAGNTGAATGAASNRRERIWGDGTSETGLLKTPTINTSAEEGDGQIAGFKLPTPAEGKSSPSTPSSKTSPTDGQIDAAAAHQRALKATTRDHRRRRSVTTATVLLDSPEAGAAMQVNSSSFAQAQVVRNRYHGKSGVEELRKIYHASDAHPKPEQQRPSTADMLRSVDPGGIPGDYFDGDDDGIPIDDGDSEGDEAPTTAASDRESLDMRSTLQRVRDEAREDASALGLDGGGVPGVPPRAPASRLAVFERSTGGTSTVGDAPISGLDSQSKGGGYTAMDSSSSATSQVVEGSARDRIVRSSEEQQRRQELVRVKGTAWSMKQSGSTSDLTMPQHVVSMPRLDSRAQDRGAGHSRSAPRLPLASISVVPLELPQATFEDGVGLGVALQHNSNEFGDLRSPRHAYITACAEAGVPPESIPIRPEDEPALRLNGFGLGDPRMVALAKALPDLPKLFEVHVADNRMSAAAAAQFLGAISKRKSRDLFVLDFSQNPVQGQAGDALQHLLESSGTAHTLRQLSLRKCKLGDKVACSIFNAASNLRQLRVLDMDDNGIDSDAGLAIAEAVSTGCSIRSLSLSWNRLGADGVGLLAGALEENLTPLQELDLGFTNCGSAGAEALGRALLQNTTLVTLGLSSNGITAHGAVVLADGMSKNASLLRLDISENPLGKHGARALVQHTMVAPERRVALLRARRAAARKKRERRASLESRQHLTSAAHSATAKPAAASGAGASRAIPGKPSSSVPLEYQSDSDEDVDDAKRVLGSTPIPQYVAMEGLQAELSEDRVFRDVRMRNCSFQDAQLGKGFDPSQPNGELDLDLSTPFDRTIAERLLRLAEESPDVNFSRILYTPPRATGLRKGHFQPDWEDKVAMEQGKAVTSSVDALQMMPAAGRGGRRASLRAASMEAAMAKAAADAAIEAAAALVGTAEDRDGRPPTSNSARKADAAARRAIESQSSGAGGDKAAQGGKKKGSKVSEAKKREREAIQRALGEVISKRPTKLCVLRVRRKLKRSVALWRALRTNMDDVVDITARHLEDDPLASTMSSAGHATSGRPSTTDGSQIRARSGGHQHKVAQGTNLGVHADIRGEILAAHFAKKAADLARESAPAERPSTTGTPTRGRGAAGSGGGKASPQSGAGKPRSGDGDSRGGRGHAQYREDEEAIEGDVSATARVFQLPYAGQLRVRVRTAVVEPHKRRIAEEEAAKVRMEKLLATADEAHPSDEGASADGRDEVTAISSSAGRLQTLIHVLNRPKEEMDRPVTRSTQGSRLGRRTSVAGGSRSSTADTAGHSTGRQSADAVERAKRSLSAIEDDRIDVVRIALEDVWLSSSEAAALMATPVMMSASRDSRVDVFVRFVQRIVDRGQVPQLMFSSLELWERRMVQAKIGLPAMRLLLGYSTGRWKLDLSVPGQRTILQRLANENLEHRKWLRSRYPGLDTSQWGNQERFRNESLDGKPFKMSAGWLAKLPQSGVLRFDFVGCIRPPARAKAINSIRFAGILRDARIFQLREATEAAEAVTYDFDLETIYQQQQEAKAEKRWGVGAAFGGGGSGSRARKGGAKGQSTSRRWVGPPPGAIVVRRGDRVVNRSSMSGCPWPPRGARTMHDVKMQGQQQPKPSKSAVQQRGAAGLSEAAGGLLGHVAGGPRDSATGFGSDVGLIRTASGVQIGVRAPGEIARGSDGRKQVISAMYRKIEQQLTGGVQVQDPVLKALAIATDDGQLLPVTPIPEDPVPDALKARKPAAVGGILPSSQASTFEPTRKAKLAGSTKVYTPALWISDRVLQLRERRRMLGAKADQEAEQEQAPTVAAKQSTAGSGAMSSGARAGNRKSATAAATGGAGGGVDSTSSSVLARLDHRADSGPGSLNWHELYVPHALDFPWTTESLMDPAELTLLKARQKGKKPDASTGSGWRHDEDEVEGGGEGEAGEPIMQYDAPPQFFSGCASTPNDLPLPPFDSYVAVRQRERGDGKWGEKLSLGGRARAHSGVEEAGGSVASGDEEIPTMMFHSFPAVFQPQRLEIRPMHPAAARALRIQAGLVLVDLLGLLVKSYLTCRQLSDLVRLLPLSLNSLRIEVVVALFPKVVDLPEFYRVLFALSVQERRAVVHRIGLLNCVDPMNIDGDVELNFKYWDERQVGGMLASLTVAESSRSFRGLGARGNPDFNSIQGWRLPSSWLQDMPREGILRVHYASTAQGASFSEETRRNLCRKVLTYC